MDRYEALVRKLAAVYTVDTDQSTVIRLVQEAQRLLAPPADPREAFQQALCDLEDLLVELRTPPTCAGCGAAWQGEPGEPVPPYCSHCADDRARDAWADRRFEETR